MPITQERLTEIKEMPVWLADAGDVLSDLCIEAINELLSEIAYLNEELNIKHMIIKELLARPYTKE